MNRFFLFLSTLILLTMTIFFMLINNTILTILFIVAMFMIMPSYLDVFGYESIKRKKEGLNLKKKSISNKDEMNLNIGL